MRDNFSRINAFSEKPNLLYVYSSIWLVTLKHFAPPPLSFTAHSIFATMALSPAGNKAAGPGGRKRKSMMKTVTQGINNLVSIGQQQEAAFVVEEMQAHQDEAPLLAEQIRSGAINQALKGEEIEAPRLGRGMTVPNSIKKIGKLRSSISSALLDRINHDKMTHLADRYGGEPIPADVVAHLLNFVLGVCDASPFPAHLEDARVVDRLADYCVQRAGQVGDRFSIVTFTMDGEPNCELFEGVEGTTFKYMVTGTHFQVALPVTFFDPEESGWTIEELSVVCCY